MSANDRQDDILRQDLRDAHETIEPKDSWDSLRTRIDAELDGRRLSPVQTAQTRRSTVLWRRMALAMAACLLVTSGLLIYMVISSGDASEPRNMNSGLLSKAQMEQLSTTFAHVRQLFGENSPWIVVGSGDDAEIGVANKVATKNGEKVLIIRLAISTEQKDAKPRYFDIVAFSNQRANFEIPMADASVVNVSLKPFLSDGGVVSVEINANINGGLVAANVETIANKAFTSLLQMQANGKQVNISAAGQLMPSI